MIVSTMTPPTERLFMVPIQDAHERGETQPRCRSPGEPVNKNMVSSSQDISNPGPVVANFSVRGTRHPGGSMRLVGSRCIVLLSSLVVVALTTSAHAAGNVADGKAKSVACQACHVAIPA